MLLLGKWEVMNLCVRGIGCSSFYDFGTVLTVCVYFVHFIYINKTLLIQILDSKYLIYWRLTYSNHVMYTWGDMFSAKTKTYNETNNKQTNNENCVYSIEIYHMTIEGRYIVQTCVVWFIFWSDCQKDDEPTKSNPPMVKHIHSNTDNTQSYIFIILFFIRNM